MAEEDARAWHQGHHGVRGLLTAILCRRKQLDLHSFALLAKFEAGKPGGEYVSASLCSHPADTVFSRAIRAASLGAQCCTALRSRCFRETPGNPVLTQD